MDQPAAPTDWQIDLQPHRSLKPRGFLILMLMLAAISFGSGVIFVRIGAWPVTGFFGIDVLLVYGAFRLNYRAGRMRERLSLIGDQFEVERIGARGRRQSWQFHPYWLRVQLQERDAESNRLILTSHGRSLAIGVFLGPAERRALAVKLNAALDRYKSPSTSFMP